ncbi:hypothetical protein Ahy_B06g080919 [Arachis hypogaea]|uniref:Endonuclease/exonuclease/phosphatase domain-containing protein n=1 Tax=Arachis hypogaea TaxID=3818 RepID=A0A444YJJ2_ARAHY|nr:hypothetical protein Ahy_B06g080919 [Arachis hypogaea]
MDNTASSSSKNTDRELMEGAILDRMREVTKQQWEDYQLATNLNRISETNANHKPLLNQDSLRRETPVLMGEDGDSRGAPSEQQGTAKEGNKKSTKGKEPMFHAKASELIMNFIVWNCRGAGGKGFSTLIRDLRKDLDVNFVILLETHISGVRGERVRNRIGLNGSFVVEARGQSGGIWCLWDSNFWKVEVMSHTFQFVHMKIKDKNANQ